MDPRISRLITQMLHRDANKFVAKMIEDSNIEKDAIATNENQILSCQFSELNGFKFIEFTLLCEYEINTFKGCKIVFFNENKSHEVDSDTQEIVANYSTISKKGICQFEADLDETIEEWIEQQMISKIEFKIAKFLISFENIDSEKLKSLWLLTRE